MIFSGLKKLDFELLIRDVSVFVSCRVLNRTLFRGVLMQVLFALF